MIVMNAFQMEERCVTISYGTPITVVIAEIPALLILQMNGAQLQPPRSVNLIHIVCQIIQIAGALIGICAGKMSKKQLLIYGM